MASVERIASSVDLPAPFGPSRPTISPLRQSSDTRVNARRRPKFRLSSRMERSRKSALTRRRSVPPRRPDRGRRVRAAPSSAGRRSAYFAASMLPARRCCSSRTSSLKIFSRLPLSCLMRAAFGRWRWPARRRPETAAEHHDGQRQRNPPRPGAVVRQPRDRYRQRRACRYRRPLRKDVSLPFEHALLNVRQLRRRQGNVADFLHQHRETWNRQRKRLLERHVAARHREPKRNLHCGLAGRKGPGDGDVIAERNGLRRTGEHRGAERARPAC